MAWTKARAPLGIVALAALLVAGVLLPRSFAGTTVPETVQIKDAAGDANYVNDQGLDSFVGAQGDNPGGPSLAPADILDVWFTSTIDTLDLHVHTAAPPPSDQWGLAYRVVANPAPPAKGCLWFEAFIPSVTYQSPAGATVEDTCNASGKLAGSVSVETLADGTGVTTMTFPKSLLPDFADGQVLAAPVAASRNLSGAKGAAEPTAPQIDNTKPGSDYLIESAVPSPSPSARHGRCKRRGARRRCR